MRFLRAVLGRLDPWAALLLGILLVLGVIILLATPGPWHTVVGPAPPAELAPQVPEDVAVFALGGEDGACTAVVWLHVDHRRPAVTAVVLAPETQGFVPGAGFSPLRRVVDQVGPGVAAAAMAQALDVPMDAWITLDRQALQLALAPQSIAGAGRVPLLQYERAQAAWEGRGTARGVWATQYKALGSTLARLPFARINIVAFSNYVLGWGHVQSDLDLQGATSLAAALSELLPGDVDVRGAAAIVESCRRGEVWRIDRSAMESMRQSLAFGLTPPPAGTSVKRRVRPARVLVVLPGPHDRPGAYVTEVRRRLRRWAGAPVAVDVLDAPRWDDLMTATRAAIGPLRPLAVLVAPPLAAEAAGDVEAAADALRRLGESLRAAGQPAVMSAPLPAEAGTSATAAFASDALIAAIRASGQPLAPLDGVSGAEADGGAAAPSGAAALRAAARANVETLVRACWPGTLAPRLASTRLGFSFAARRRTTVGLSTATSLAAPTLVPQLRTWGYQTRIVPEAGWTPEGSAGVYYREGMQAAALTLAGDLGLPAASAVEDGGAPSALTLSLTR